MPGWGTYPYGTSPWAGTFFSGVTILESVSVSELLDVNTPVQVVGATPLSAHLVEVSFNHPLDFGYAPLLSVSNYSVFPFLSVTSVYAGLTPNTVRLGTGDQVEPIYTLTVTEAKSTAGDTLDPAHRTAIFAGYLSAPSFYTAAQSRTKIQLVFSEEMLQNAAFLDTDSYVVTDLNFNTLVVASVAVYGPAPVQRLTLEVAEEMDPGGYYVVNIVNPNVKTASGLNLNPTYDMFQWKEMQVASRNVPLSIDIADFSGEISEGLLGQPLGQVFFSPALEAAIANSSIQIDSVSCCTRAYDTYTMPSLPDPYPLMTFGSGFPYNTVIGASGNVLWAPAERLGQARFALADFQEETMPQAVDGPADAILQETFDQSRVSLLNVDTWVLFDGVGTPFATADNLTPIPAGTTTNINLQP